MKVLIELASFPAANQQELYAGVASIDWPEHLNEQTTFAVRAHASDTMSLEHSGFVALKTKDAIVDRLRDRTGSRPNVDPRDPDVSVVVHVHRGQGRVFLDLAGEPLHRRGYRVVMTDAPLKETLAASVLSLAAVPTDGTFLDPMAGSGTLAIEQALRARDIAPGLQRRFGFERWPSEMFGKHLDEIRQEARDRVLPRAPADIICRDIDPEAVEAARRNAAAAGVANDIRFEVAALASLCAPGPTGAVCTNPPYDQRSGSRGQGKKDPAREMARVFSLFRGWQLSVLTPDRGLAPALGQRPDFSHRLWNGGLEVQLQQFTLT